MIYTFWVMRNQPMINGNATSRISHGMLHEVLGGSVSAIRVSKCYG